MSGAFRLAHGGRINRSKTLRFRFDGKEYVGCAGDTLASALIANGVHLMGRSFKYHRPRGLLSTGSDEPNALVGVGRDEAHYSPNLRASQVELYDGLLAESQNRYPTLGFDLGAINDLFSPLIPAGFYYKTFMWPAGAWKRLYEPRIRAMAGLGRAPRAPDADRYVQRFGHCDVLVVGAGPAGLAAAEAAAAAGARVIVCDEQTEFGGSLLADHGASIDGLPAGGWIERTIGRIAKSDRATLLPRTTAFGYFTHNLVALVERVTDHLAEPNPHLPRERLWQVRAKEVVLATGATERPLVFPDNDRPGIMLAGAAQALVNRYGVKPGTRAVIATANDQAYGAALDLARAGVDVASIVDLRFEADGALPDAARKAGIAIRTGATLVGTTGRLRVDAALVSAIGSDGKTGSAQRIACDHIAMSGGFTPTVHLFSQSKSALRFDQTLQAYVPGTSVERVRAAGAARGLFGLEEALADGWEQGEAACLDAGFRAPRASSRRQVAAQASGNDTWLGATPHGRNPAFVKAFVDFQNDVTAKDVTLAIREGFESIEHVKRYTTSGMATDQGKTSNMNTLSIAASALGKSIPEVGHTTFRMPYTPVTFGALAGMSRGELFDPARTTPIHRWAETRGAVFEDVGLWKRARYFPVAREDMHAAVARECKSVRSGVGIFDASTLGKIEVVGPDAAEFMNRMYVNAWTKLEPGRTRYGVMLREDGFVLDDGVVGRLAAYRFHVTTTTGGAPRVLAMMEDYLQTEWPELDVWLTSTTEEWGVIAVQGPNARKVIAPLIEGIDLDPAAMPHMSIRTGHICGVPTRLFRVSFTGELGFEVNVAADYAPAVWEAIFAAGASYGITPYGTETMHVLRAEKGYIIVGQETDGTATPDDVGLGWAVGKAKRDFVGKRSLARAAMARPDRKQLVGLLTEDPAIVLEEGAQIVADPGQKVPMTMLGHVTSSYRSPTLDRSIALAMVAGGRALTGKSLHVPMPDRAIAVRVVNPVFVDPEGKRLDG
jgi:sarcosine oxidase subunit alpha